MADVIRRKWITLAAVMLDAASDHYGNHGCNDWDYPSRWTDAEREEFGRAVKRWNGNEGDYDPELPPPDYIVMGFLAGCLRAVASRIDQSVLGEETTD